MRHALRWLGGALGDRWAYQRSDVLYLGRRNAVPVLYPGDIVVLDNLGSHKVTGIEEAMTAAGAQLRFLPPYSPDLNSIEQVFFKMRTHLRKAVKRAVKELWPAIGELMDEFAPDECERYLRHAGYSQSA